MASSRSMLTQILSIFTLVGLASCAQISITTEDALASEVSTTPTNLSPHQLVTVPSPVDSVSVQCEPDQMILTFKLLPSDDDDRFSYDNPSLGTFNGIVYPAGLGKNSSCLQEYRSARGQLQYILPLRACNTMARDMEDDTVEYYNSIVVQPHLRLLTGQGRGFDARCRYARRELAHYRRDSDGIRADMLSGNSLDYDSDLDIESDGLPSCTMKIYKGDPSLKQVAANVKIGEPLTLVISLEKQERYGLLVSDCVVRDGLGWAEQSLISDDGCPLDGEIMGMFQYSGDRTRAQVAFPAHRFPYSAAVYYSCAVRLCHKADGDACEPCSGKKRVRRQTSDDEGSPATIEVFSGLYVNEVTDLPESDEVSKEKTDDSICVSQRSFAIGICIAGVVLMLAVIAAIAIILARRRRPKTSSRTGSSLYSGPYTNTGYSHTS